jgi:ribulose-phosphate 3-epimerase
MPKFAPSILACDFLHLGEALAATEEAGADRFHVDVMDGSFVPNLGLGIPIVEAVRRGTSLPVEVHLMIERPERYVDAFAGAGSDRIIVHQEASPNLHRTVYDIRRLGKEVSVGLNPGTPASMLDEVLVDIHGILVMTVNPGFGGQHFIESALGKVRKLRETLRSLKLDREIEVDGGIDAKTAPRAVEAGADVLVAGSSVFGDPGGPAAGLRRLMHVCGAPLTR